MSGDYKEDSVEAKIARLEAQCKKQDEKIRLLGTVLSVVHFSPFDSPLAKFFARADNFLDFVVEDKVPAWNECTKTYRKALARCGDNETCRERVLAEFENCTGGNPPF
jgi:hypothetical protein